MDSDYPSSSDSSHSSQRLDSSSLMTSSDTDTVMMSRSPGSSRHCSSLASWTPERTISVSSSPLEPSSPLLLNPLKSDSPPPTTYSTSEPLAERHMTEPSPAISLPSSPAAQQNRSPSPCWLMADLRFGRCVTPVSLPVSLPASLPTSRPPSPVIGLTEDMNHQSVLNAVGLTATVNRQPVLDDVDGDSSSSSSSEDEQVEAKRLKLDPDYTPSTASESPLTTAANSQEASEEEEEENKESETEEDDESWHPSASTSPEIVTTPEDD